MGDTPRLDVSFFLAIARYPGYGIKANVSATVFGVVSYGASVLENTQHIFYGKRRITFNRQGVWGAELMTLQGSPSVSNSSWMLEFLRGRRSWG